MSSIKDVSSQGPQRVPGNMHLPIQPPMGVLSVLSPSSPSPSHRSLQHITAGTKVHRALTSEIWGNQHSSPHRARAPGWVTHAAQGCIRLYAENLEVSDCHTLWFLCVVFPFFVFLLWFQQLIHIGKLNLWLSAILPAAVIALACSCC